VVHLHRAGSATDSDRASGAAPARVGLVVSKAVGPAVTRNQVKRRLRHLLRDRVALLPAGSVLVVRALPASAQASSTTLAADLDRALTRADRPS
jgi:ribonuclease P protein component